jgi:hypothetical protein
MSRRFRYSLLSDAFQITNATLANVVFTNATYNNIALTGITTGTLLASTSISTGQLSVTNITASNIVTTFISGANLLVTSVSTIANLTLTGGTTAANLFISTGNLIASGNSNTIGNIITTGGNVGIGITSPQWQLDVNGGIEYTYHLHGSSGSIFSQSTTGTQQFSTNSQYITKRLHGNYGNANRVVQTWTTRRSGLVNSVTGVCWAESDYAASVTSGNFNSGMFVAVLNASTTVATSSDGMNWVLGNLSSLETYREVCYAPELKTFLAVGGASAGGMMTSTNGTTWSQFQEGTFVWQSVCWSPEVGRFVAGGNGSALRTSSTGLSGSWSVGSAPGNLNSICWSPELRRFVGVGLSTAVSTSNSGTTFVTTGVSGVPASNNWTCVCWSAELSIFVAVSVSDISQNIMTSADGLTWIGRDRPTGTPRWLWVCWSGELSIFVAGITSGTGITDQRVATSPDGINWTMRLTGGTTSSLESICWSPELSMFIAGLGTSLISSDLGLPNARSALMVNPAHMLVNN